MKLNKENLSTLGIIVAVFVLALGSRFGFLGVRLSIAMGLFFVLPFYLLLERFELEAVERGIFAFFLGIGLFPTLVYPLGFVMPLSIAIWVVFGVLVGAYFALGKFFSSH